MSLTTAAAAPADLAVGAGLPVPGTWSIDPGHTEVAFIGRHLMLTKVRGRFRRLTGAIHVGANAEETTVDVTIDMASVDSGDETRDEHLRSADLFDVAAHPTATFSGRGRRWTDRSGQLEGDLTIKGVTRLVVLDVEYLGWTRDPWGNDRAVFSASGRVDREDFGLTWNMALEAGGILVSKEIRIELELEAVRQAPEA